MTDERKEGQSSNIVHTGTAIGWYRCDGKDCPVCGEAPAQPEPRGSEALEDSDVLSDVMEIFWPLGTTSDQDAQFDKQRAALKKVLTEYFVPLAAATAERTPHVHSSDCYAYPVSGAKKYLICDAPDRQPAPLVAKSDTTPTRAMIEAEPRDWLPELKQNPLDVAYNAIWKLWDKDPDNQQLVLALQAIQRIGQPAPAPPQPKAKAPDQWPPKWASEGALATIARLKETAYERGWQSAIEAAAQHVMLPSASAFAFCCSGCEWRIQTEEDVSAAMRSFAAHIRSLRPSPAQPYGGADGDQWPNDQYTEIVLPAPKENPFEPCFKCGKMPEVNSHWRMEDIGGKVKQGHPACFGLARGPAPQEPK